MTKPKPDYLDNNGGPKELVERTKADYDKRVQRMSRRLERLENERKDIHKYLGLVCKNLKTFMSGLK